VPLPKQTTREELIRKFRRLGWTGPFPGSRHAVMRRNKWTVRIPNPHRSDVSIGLLRTILRASGH
jgi:hypothetical protein